MHYFDFHYSWEQRKLGDVVDVRSGKDYKHLSEGNIPVYGTGGFMLSVNQALSYDEDAIGIGRKGTIDKPYILKAPFWTVDTLFYAIPREKVDLNFAFDVFQNIDWKKKDTHNKHLSVLDYKKQERAKEVATLEEELEGTQVVLKLKEERIDSLEKEIESKRDDFRKEQSEAQKKLDDTIAENQKLQSKTTDLRLKNSELRLEYYENVDKLTDKQKEIEVAQKEADKWMMISHTAKLQTERAEFELEEAEKLKKELLGSVDGDDYLKEQVKELRYQNQILKEDNRSLKDKLEKAYEFMKQFVIGGINLLEKFMEWIWEKVKDVGSER